MFSSISVAIPRGKTGFLVALFSLILLDTILAFLSMGHRKIPVPFADSGSLYNGLLPFAPGVP